jgi:hypothetical protein
VKRKRLYFWRYYDDEDYDDFNSNDEILVAEGKATTDRNGNFNISFNTDPNPEKSQKLSVCGNRLRDGY